MYKIILVLAISTIVVFSDWHDDDIYQIKYHYNNKAYTGNYIEKELIYSTNLYKLTPHPIYQLKEVTIDRNNNGIINTIINYVHDKKGNILSSIVYDIEDDSKIKIDNSTYQYNKNNDILKVTDYAGTYNFTYNQSSYLIKDSAYGYNILYTYTSNTISTHSEGSSTAIIYTYNSQNKIIKIHAEEDGISQGEGRIFTYDSTGNMISDTSSAWKATYKYNNNNKIISSIRQDIQHDTYIYDTYTYNNNSQLVKRVHNDDDPNESYTQTFTYNINKQLIRDIYDIDSDNNIEIDIRYTYDNNDNVIKIQESGTYYGETTYNYRWKDTRIKEDYSWLSAIYNMLLN